MQFSTTFDSTNEQLSHMLATIRTGKTQLPDFQRGWVWDDEHIRCLLASISRSFPVGAVMMFLTLPANVEPERLILDRQQRLTSLFQALCSGEPVATNDPRGKAMGKPARVQAQPVADATEDFEDEADDEVAA